VKWDTRKGAKTDRIASPWRTRTCIDPQAVFLFVPAEQVLDAARQENGNSFDAPGADFIHRDGKYRFAVPAEEFSIQDPAVRMLAQIVHGADIPLARTSTGSWNLSSPSTVPFSHGAGSGLTRPIHEKRLIRCSV